MTTAILESQSQTDMQLLIELAQKLGIKARFLNNQELQEMLLIEKIDAGMRTETVSREVILKALRK